MKKPVITVEERNRRHLAALLAGPLDVTASGYYHGTEPVLAALSTDRFRELARAGWVAIKQGGDLPVYSADLRMLTRGTVKMQVSITALGRRELEQLQEVA